METFEEVAAKWYPGMNQAAKPPKNAQMLERWLGRKTQQKAVPKDKAESFDDVAARWYPANNTSRANPA